VTAPPIATNALDIQGLEQLRRGAARDSPAALAEVAVQFDAMFIGMMLDSARSANLGGNRKRSSISNSWTVRSPSTWHGTAV
jgi:Rod binding domain-containing protein